MDNIEVKNKISDLYIQKNLLKQEVINAKPFLKWAGGKTQLLNEIDKRLPPHILSNKNIDSYIEPFVGGGAVFFYLRSKYFIKRSFLFDINRELIISYKVIQNNPIKLINHLYKIENMYLKKSKEERKKFYYEIRDIYNKQMHDFDYKNYNEEWIKRAVYLLFLNKTCYNGLFRQNKKGEFNVPYGRYKNPQICDEKNIIEVNKALKNTEIFCDDFTKSEEFIKKDSLVYLDPPYRPLSSTSSFTSYDKEGFSDRDQKRLADFFEKMDKKGAYLILSNSDPKNENPNDDFFDKLYFKYNIERVPAKRYINCDASKRGEINELIIRNYL
ncbi:MAG TPA: DNA adenine methylase [Candidatus Atribacteria bacterium]|nr:DNA adenine methylase [Candidatus Atribacteria bacterium]